MSNASFLERLTEKNFKVACLSSFLYWTGPRPSELLLNACFSESRVTLSVNAGEALMKSQIGWISISRCIDTKFGTKVKRNVTNALDKSKSSLSNKKNDKVLGCHMFGEAASEIIQMVSVSLNVGITKKDFDNTMALHPTISEEFVTMYG